MDAYALRREYPINLAVLNRSQNVQLLWKPMEGVVYQTVCVLSCYCRLRAPSP